MTQEEQHVHVPSDKQAELIHWHYPLGHLSFPKLKILAKIGKIPKHLANMPPPVCAGCAFGAITKVPWRGKGQHGQCSRQPSQGSACPWITWYPRKLVSMPSWKGDWQSSATALPPSLLITSRVTSTPTWWKTVISWPISVIINARLSRSTRRGISLDCNNDVNLRWE